jgi:ATP-binding cassette subfamily F protein 3
LEACADRLWLVEGGGVSTYSGDLDDYRKLILSGAGERDGSAGRSIANSRSSRTDARRVAAERRIELAPLRRRIQAAEAEMERLTVKIAQLDTALASPGLFERDAAQAAALAKSRAAASDALAKAEAEWLEASSVYEAENA